jgi:ubiquinone/menaquinone biosynthesis C-methylase UbiE
MSRFLLGTFVLLLAGAASAESESDRVAALLGLRPGVTVADIGAGDGDYALDFARRVGPSGRVYATELGEEKLAELRESARDAGLANLEVVAAQLEATGLPTACCAAIFLRHVYHHLSAPAAVDKDLLRALAPGGRLVIVDFPPTWFLVPFAPEGVGEERTSHGITIDAALRELEAAGFAREQVIADFDPSWLGPDGYALVLRRPDE